MCTGYTYSQKIAEDQHRDDQTKTLKEMVLEEYWRYTKVFSEEELHRLPKHKPWDHTIDLKEGAPETIRARIFPTSQPENKELGRFLDNALAKGYIVPSKLSMVSPVFFVKKKDGKLRFVQDYRKLNKIMIKNHYSLPLASDIINRLSKAKHL